ncbi:MAG TPA: nucleotide sugar dehydrogenase [Flavobacteriales bacterium]|jgi:UDP-N-acetyl-D-galactosamine dehydrogenase|nr:nucleotide sugar dehydrogenase [Flavobacteriales bacterium]MBP9177296.1 nucleotide sugar dehydrogenase [Flavobacteriales bacterium]MCC6910984.1 nucleotide sugar dehydrogenase [Flavobacteriales bacterium]HQW06007.1 nucleotide sugar dehydrogenase [Flavobacteriales bacterium]HQW99183.1 nucleotide sugar dehydrogenase [Flavobacteriales bacterium]
MSNLYDRLLKKEAKLAVIGLGYVGLPIALAFARKIKVVGFDINQKRVDMMRNGEDPSNELDASEFEGRDIHFTADLEDLRDVEFFIVAVPTPIDSQNIPDLTPLLGATRTVGQVLKKNDYVVYESTVYPGCTEEDCVPLLERLSNLKFVEDFKVGYSPERINPGDKEHTLESIIKVSSGCDPESAEIIAKVYELVVKAGVHRAASIKVAEAAKIIENTQRDVNIALINELSIIFNRMGINTYDVLEAAGTKWNFLKFQPGLVGGHCIGVDPYYLVYKAKELGYHAQIIDAGRFVNDSMGGYTAKQTVKKIIASGTNPADARVLVMGATFKENVTDIRNSKVADVINELKSFSCSVDVTDPHADAAEVEHEYGYKLAPEMKGPYDAIIVAVNHSEYVDKDEAWFKSMLKPKGVLVDLKGIFRTKIKDLTYWSL